MELGPKISAVSNLVKKYRYVALVLIIGLTLMVIPFGSNSNKKEITESKSPSVDDVDLSTQLSNILSNVDGAGHVSILLTVGEGELTLYQTDTDITNRENESIERTSTVTVTDANRNQAGLIRQINPPKYLGAVVVCDGADDPSVRLAVAEAVSKATGLGLDRISVLKMK